MSLSGRQPGREPRLFTLSNRGADAEGKALQLLLGGGRDRACALDSPDVGGLRSTSSVQAGAGRGSDLPAACRSNAGKAATVALASGAAGPVQSEGARTGLAGRCCQRKSPELTFAAAAAPAARAFQRL